MGPGRIALIEWKDDGVEEVLRDLEKFFDQVRNLPQVPARTGAVRPEESATA
jgi:hypothetical protein